MPTLTTRAGKGSELTHNELDANFTRPVTQKTTTYQVLASDNRSVIEGNHATTAFTVTLPAVATAAAEDTGDFEVTITNINVALVSVDGSGSETINGSTSVIKLAQWEAITFQLNSAQTGWIALRVVGPPAGEIIMWPTATAPSGYLECDGSAVSRVTYARLFSVISDDYGSGDGSTTFNLPDVRGYFVRGWDNSAGTDPDAASRTDRGDGTTGDNVGTKQADELKSHKHTIPLRDEAGGADIATMGQNTTADSTDNTGNTGGNETRGINIAFMFCIRT